MNDPWTQIKTVRRIDLNGKHFKYSGQIYVITEMYFKREKTSFISVLLFCKLKPIEQNYKLELGNIVFSLKGGSFVGI